MLMDFLFIYECTTRQDEVQSPAIWTAALKATP